VPYRDDIEASRAAVRRLEATRDALRTEIALVESLPTSRSLETRVLGSPSRLSRTSAIDEPFDPSSGGALGEALAKSYGLTGRLEESGRAITWRADLAPRGRSVEVSITPDDRGRTRVEITDRMSPTKHMVWGGMALLPTVFNMLMRGQWMAFAGTAVFLAASILLLRRMANRPIARRREHEAMGAERAVERTMRLHGLNAVRARVVEPEATPIDAGADRPIELASPVPDARAAARSPR
jgi:hypothetical protein